MFTNICGIDMYVVYHGQFISARVLNMHRRTLCETPTGATAGLLLKGVRALLGDKSFSLKTDPAMAAHKTAEQLLAWITPHLKCS